MANELCLRSAGLQGGMRPENRAKENESPTGHSMGGGTSGSSVERRSGWPEEFRRWGGLPGLRGRRGNVRSVGLPLGGDELGVAEAAEGTGEGEDPTEGACGRAGGGPEHPEVGSRRSLRSLSWRRSPVKHLQEALGGFRRPGEPRNRASTLNASPREHETERDQSWWRSRPNCAPSASGSRIEASEFG